MTVLLAFIIQVTLLACIPFYFARQDSSLRSTSFFCYLSMLVIMGDLLGSVYSFPITDSIVISSGNIFYCAFMMTTILFVIIQKDIEIIRTIIRLVISVNLFSLALLWATWWALRIPETLNPINVSASVLSSSMVVTAIGGVLTIAELFILFILFERIKSRMDNVYAISILYIAAFILVLCLNGLLFPFLLHPFTDYWPDVVAGSIASKFVLAILFSVGMLIFLAVHKKRLLEYIGQPLLLRELMAVPRQKLIEELERKNESLVTSDLRFRHLAESIDDIFFSIDENMRCTYWNKASERSGYTAEQVVGNLIFELYPEAEDKPLETFYRNVLKTGKPGQTINIIRTNEQDRYYEIWAYPFGNGVSVLAKDVTERKEMEAQLLQSQRMESIGRLAGGIAHDFNNILVPITANAELGMMQLSPDNSIYPYLKRVKEAAEQAASLTRQILAVSRKQVLEMQVLDLNTVLTDYETMIQRLIGEDIKVVTILDPDLAPVNADRGQIGQVLLNLVINARDAMPSGGTLTIETANIVLDQPYREQHSDTLPAGSYSMMLVSDTGHGMDSSTRRQIFEPFFTTKTQGKGTGLGLATVFGIVKQHSGYILVTSEPGMGSVFRLYLQHVKEAEQTPRKATPISHSENGKETILLVEDEKMVRNIVCEALETFGYTVLEAQDTGDALRMAADSGKIHLLLTDVIMPDMNGRELYLEIAALQPSINVLFMSGYTDDVIADHGILEEGVNFLQKPFSVRNLIQKVRDCLDKAEE